MKNRIKKMREPGPPRADNLSLADLVQFNGRVPVGMKFAVKNSTKLAGLDLEVVMQDAFKLYLGIEDDMIAPRREMVRKAFKTLHGDKRPFELPLTPINSNAVLTTSGASSKLTFRFKRMGS